MALLNVLINARDAMTEEGTVSVGTSMLGEPEHRQRLGLPPGRYLVLCVIDEGEGMTPEVLQRATEPFFTTKGPGTGLGLAMVHGFVRQSHGRLEITSSSGQGTTVRMIFPVADEVEEQTTADEPPDNAVVAPAGNATILLADDNDDVRDLGRMSLEASGYHVLTMPSGERALAVLEGTEEVHLLFSDVVMPGAISGLELADQVRERWPGLPILLTTGYMEQMPGRDDRDALPVLAKPYHQADLLHKIEATLSGAALRPHPAAV